MTNVTTFPGADCGSDHQLLVATVQVRLKRIQKLKVVPNMQSINISGFREGFKQRMGDLPNEKTDSDSKWEYFKRIIQETARDNKMAKPAIIHYSRDGSNHP